MAEKTYENSLEELKIISNKIGLYVNNNASVPDKLSTDFALSVIGVLNSFASDIGQERLEEMYSDIDRYYEGLEEKVSRDIGLLSPVKKKLLIQGYKTIRDKLESYAKSNYLEGQTYDSIMDISNFLNKSCNEEYCKTDHYKRKDFDYADYFYGLRSSTTETAKEAYITSINNLISSKSDADFYHYLELCSSSGAALDAIILMGQDI